MTICCVARSQRRNVVRRSPAAETLELAMASSGSVGEKATRILHLIFHQTHDLLPRSQIPHGQTAPHVARPPPASGRRESITSELITEDS